MKRCIICRALNVDDAETCSRCGHQLISMIYSGWTKVAIIGMTVAILGTLILWALSISISPAVYPFIGVTFTIGILSILLGLVSFRFSE
jgi:uncharacterized paraquat-inducible protein A